MHWQTSRFRIDLSRPRVMGIVNVTPDSFSDGGRFASTPSAAAHCEALLAQGADILDIGGESSRPGTPPVDLEEERRRVLPVLRHAVTLGVPVSVDTYKPEMMREALDLGADIVNDIFGLRRHGALEAVAAHPRCGVCIMHMHGEPQTMQRDPMQGDAVPQVRQFLQGISQALLERGVARERVAWDPGIGFGKTVEQNFALLARQQELLSAGYALLVGWSRKSSLGTVTGLPVDERLAPSVAAALLAVERGAHVVRVHEVKETVAALKVRVAMMAALGASLEHRE
ncbi:dihydropteroate synthase [Ramlibacter solisilvae]|uniref:Dihydropteroate synthase n=1 Tax=Ramlibacter tataouinensis TaxID=94132 RepID=A0A127JNS2_9BURK|nr:dihydropteroate synthase [Ramlibacter tataouinensis]AMO21650.1 dihydropteroate synthase [Ramlibacter tataouinensis]